MHGRKNIILCALLLSLYLDSLILLGQKCREVLLHLLVPLLQTDDQTLFETVKSAFSYSRAYILLCSLLNMLCFCQHTDKVIQILEAITLSLYVGTAFKIWYAKSNEALKHNFMTRGTFFIYVFF